MSLASLLAQQIHIRRRDWKLAAGMRRADAIICFHAKSGSTWLRAMISHVYHQCHATPVDLLIQNDNLKRLNSKIPAIYFGDGLEVRGHYSGAVLARARSHQRVVLLLRDPRDVSVSFYRHLRERATPRELVRKRVSDEVRALDLYAFMLHPEFGLPRVIERFNAWASQAADFEQALIVTYEDLWQDATGELGRVMQLLGSDAPRPVLQAAADFASLPSLREKEQSGFFIGERLKPVTAGGKPAFKVREGGIHGHRQLFTPEQLAQLDAMVADRLHPALGYGAAQPEPASGQA